MSRIAARPLPEPEDQRDGHLAYLEMLALVERLHRLLLDVVKDDFERLQIFEVNAVQGLLLFNIGDKVVSAGELRSRGYYQGSNVSYNLKKLVEGGFLHHERSSVDRRSVRVGLTEKGRRVHDVVAELFEKHSRNLVEKLGAPELERLNDDLRTIERFWSETIRYTY